MIKKYINNNYFDKNLFKPEKYYFIDDKYARYEDEDEIKIKRSKNEEALELLEALKQLQYEDETSQCIIKRLEELLK